MRKALIILTLVVLISFFYKSVHAQSGFWTFHSIDTMKYSRDPSREKLGDPKFDKVIDQQVKEIADTGATHVAIATPYDSEFLPILTRWVTAARRYHLKVWFRGNWSGWEGWFGYKKITRDEHFAMTKQFILDNRSLFQNGDIFSACPECENGGPGDPRQTGDVVGHRNFLIKEYVMTKSAFQQIHKQVASNYNSMNGDIAKLVMDKPTTEALDGIIVIDHYTATPDETVTAIHELIQNTGGRIVLGEFGAPIPDIHGDMTGPEQAQWIQELMTKLIQIPQVIGANYWVGVGGSTQLWDEKGQASPAVSVIRRFYTMNFLTGKVTDLHGEPVEKAQISTYRYETNSDSNGQFLLSYTSLPITLTVKADSYIQKSQLVSTFPIKTLNVVVFKQSDSFWDIIMHRLRGLVNRDSP